MTLNVSLRRHGEARERAGAADSIHRQSIGRFQLYVKNVNFYYQERPVCY